MAIQYAIDLTYEVTISGLSVVHNNRVRVALEDPNNEPAIGTTPDLVSLATKGIGGVAGTRALDIALSEYLGAFADMYGAEMNVTSAVLSKYPFGLDGAGIYVSPVDLGDPNINYETQGSNGNPCTPSQGLVVTFFDGRGGVSKLQFSEVVGNRNDQAGTASLDLSFSPMATYITSADSVVKGVNNSNPNAIKLFSFGQNEATWRKRNR